MDLRSSRSRSKTPFVVETFDKKIIEQGNHVEKSTTVVRTTRRTTSAKANTVSSSSMEAFSSSSQQTKPVKKTIKEKHSKKLLTKTSDYSSEEGDLDITPNRSITENEKNQIIEDARALANGSGDISALDLYRSSDRYWEKYPKTDYTYSRYSRDRFEIAPGEVIMPNMSRRTIHNIDCTITDTSHKSTNTESLQNYNNLYRSEALQRRKLFNNNYEDTVDETTYSKITRTVWWRVKRSFLRILTTIVSVFYYFYSMQNSVFSKLHRFCSWIMLLDTYLMRKESGWRKREKLILLCLIPLLLFGAWWLLSSMGSLLYATWMNSTTSQIKKPLVPLTGAPYVPLVEVSKSYEFEEQRPGAAEIAAGLSAQQLEAIAEATKNRLNINDHIKTEEIVQRILNNPSFINIVNNYQSGTSDSGDSKAQDQIINSLRQEINLIKSEMADKERRRTEEIDRIIRDFRNQNDRTAAKFTYQLRRCCQKPVINIEGYVNRAIENYLNNPDFLNNQQGFAAWLQSVLLAKDDFEVKMADATKNLDAKFQGLVEDSGRTLMDKIATKITMEMNKKVTTEKQEVSLGAITDEQIKRIVRRTLAVYDADKTGLVDYAMEPMGGQIISTRCTENYHSGKAVVSVLGIPLWYPSNTPRTVITPGVNPGECWAFENFPGFLVIKLSDRVKIEGFTLEHVSKLLVPNGKIDSAPKNFEVYGLMSETDRDPILLGQYVYDYDGEAVQFFPVQKEDQIFDHIEIRVTSNHGNPNYTCLYRFRVHGKVNHEDR